MTDDSIGAISPRRISAPKACAILGAVVFLTFGRLLFCDFTWWDDSWTIHQNPKMHSVGLDSVLYYWEHAAASIYIPLTYTVWAVLATIARVSPGEDGIALNPAVFHAANVLVHAAGACAAWLLFRRLLKNDLAALLGAMLWAVHPVQVESVGWISGLKDVLAGSLSIACLWQYVRWRQTSMRLSYAFALVLYVLAMLAKPSAMTTPLLLLVIDRFALGNSFKRMVLPLLPFVLFAVPIAIVARYVQPSFAARSALWMRPFIVGDAVAFYAMKVVAPIHLAFDYGRNPAFLRASPQMWFTWLLPVAVAVGTLWFYRSRRRRGLATNPMPIVALLMFVFAPLHVLGLTQFDFQAISTVADHYLYVAMLGPALLAGLAVAHWPRRLLVPTFIVIGLLAVRSAVQAATWQDEIALMSNALRVNPKSWTAYNNLAFAAGRALDLDRERELLLKAEALNRDEPQIQLGLISLEERSNHPADAEVHARRIIEQYDEFWAAEHGESPDGYIKVVQSFLLYKHLDAAERFADEGLRRFVGQPDLLRSRAQIRLLRARTPTTTSRPTPNN